MVRVGEDTDERRWLRRGLCEAPAPAPGHSAAPQGPWRADWPADTVLGDSPTAFPYVFSPASPNHPVSQGLTETAMPPSQVTGPKLREVAGLDQGHCVSWAQGSLNPKPDSLSATLCAPTSPVHLPVLGMMTMKRPLVAS